MKWTWIQRWSVSVLTQHGEVCSADASAFSPGAILALRNLEITSPRFTWLAGVMAGQCAGNVN